MEQDVSELQSLPKHLKYRNINDKLSNLVESYGLKSDYLRGIARNVQIK
jgi:hypothetical protein